MKEYNSARIISFAGDGIGRLQMPQTKDKGVLYVSVARQCGATERSAKKALMHKATALVFGINMAGMKSHG